jgi:hypothetical protein
VIAKLALLFLRALVKGDIVLIFCTKINKCLIFRQKLLPVLEGRGKRLLQPAGGDLLSVLLGWS